SPLQANPSVKMITIAATRRGRPIRIPSVVLFLSPGIGRPFPFLIRRPSPFLAQGLQEPVITLHRPGDGPGPDELVGGMEPGVRIAKAVVKEPGAQDGREELRH